MKFSSRILKSEKGVALLMAVSAISLILVLVMEVTYESMVEYTINSQNLNRIQAYYAAKSGADLSLLRIKMYQRVKNQLGKNAGPYEKYLNMIWQYPLSWPLPLPAELSGVDRSSYADAQKESLMEASYVASIEDEGSKIDVNDLASKSESLRKTTYNKILSILNQSLESKDHFRQKYTSSDFEEILNNMADWMSSTSSSASGGSKKTKFADLNANAEQELYPPNRPFRTLEEIKLVPKMDEEIFNLLKSQITIYGMKGINPNTATDDVLKSIDPGITDEIVSEIKKERELQPFTDAKSFWSFLETTGARLQNNPDDIEIQTESLSNFKITSLGVSGGTTRELQVITVDLNSMANQIKKAIDKDKKSTTETSTSSQPSSQESLPKGPPQVLYWNER